MPRRSRAAPVPGSHYDAQVIQAENRLSRLLGEEPGTLRDCLDTRAPQPPACPFRRHRPAGRDDPPPSGHRGSRGALAAQTARIGVATAQLYPTLRINGSVGLQSGNTVNLFEAASRFFSIPSVPR